MPHNDAPFDFDERITAPDGRIIRQQTGRPRRRRCSAVAEMPSLEDLLRQSIREVTEREIRKAQNESDLSDLLRRMLEHMKRRAEGNA